MAPPEGGKGLLRSAQAFGSTLKRIPRGWAGLLALLWAAGIAWLGSRPSPGLGQSGPLGSVLSNLAHAPLYGLLALWLALSVPRRGAVRHGQETQGGWPVFTPRAIVAILAMVVLCGVLDEIHQAFVPTRDASAFDVLTDFVGASATLSCALAATGPRASSSGLLLRLVGSVFACVLAASLAAFAPDLYPGHPWL